MARIAREEERARWAMGMPRVKGLGNWLKSWVLILPLQHKQGRPRLRYKFGRPGALVAFGNGGIHANNQRVVIDLVNGLQETLGGAINGDEINRAGRLGVPVHSQDTVVLPFRQGHGKLPLVDYQL